MRIKFCGAASGVTGSCHMISTENHKILLDCGQFQGGKQQEALNAEPFPFDPEEIECVILSHAHIDHCGRLPLLVKRGFKGDIYCTDATADLLEVMLRDSGFIHEKEAEWQNRKNERAGRKPVEPLYTLKDSEETLKHVKPIMYDQLFEVNDSMKAVFNDAGHILGSAIIELWITENEKVTKVVFSGDLGVLDRPILRDPTIIKKADCVIMESTYGNRLHPQNATSIEELLDIVIKTTKRGGTVVIPSFAVGRTQELIFEFNRFYEERPEYRSELEKLKVYIDSPMATTATEVFRKNAQVFDEETKAYILKGDNPLDFQNLKFVRSTAESQALNMDNASKVIISASGMCEAGRIRHHLKHNLWDGKNSVVFVGYQAEGTLGRALTTGTKDIALFGEAVHVNAEIYNLEGFSGHADRDGLIGWLKGFQKKPAQLFLVHGEEESKIALAETIKKETGMDATVVTQISEFEVVNSEIVGVEEIYKDAIDNEAVEATRLRLSEVHRQMENLLYSTGLAIGEEMTPEKMSKINDLVLELQKVSLNLGSAITAEDIPKEEIVTE